IKKLMQKVVDLGGVITGEHGIGLAKIPFMGMQHSKAEIAAMRAVKDALDPQGILNPGKIFEYFEIWDHELVDVKLPWDHR
ncbi:MAG TPA: FAD-binding oxidoreductase, partial [Opitutae bacterium]|nr:FAD-binding oxidoreductase [Opitutae bacterium]